MLHSPPFCQLLDKRLRGRPRVSTHRLQSGDSADSLRPKKMHFQKWFLQPRQATEDLQCLAAPAANRGHGRRENHLLASTCEKRHQIKYLGESVQLGSQIVLLQSFPTEESSGWGDQSNHFKKISLKMWIFLEYACFSKFLH